jgi:hypothetical protein
MNKRNVLILVLAAAALGAWYAWKEYNREPAGAADVEAQEKVEAVQFFNAFTTDEAAADARFKNKVVEVSGTVRSVETDQYGKTNVTFETGDPLGGVVCEFDSGIVVQCRASTPATVKGFYQGYNLDVLLQRCAVVAQ